MSRRADARAKHRRMVPEGADDQELWRYATRDMEPLRAKPRVGAVAPSATAPGRPKKAAPEAAIPSAPRQTLTERPSKPAQHAPQPAEFDHRLARKLASGRRTIEARVDLHGMRQAQAHRVLREFLIRCQGDGLGFVLVITGKGAAVAQADRADGLTQNRTRGVLRSMVPGWLAEPELRALVVSHRTASRQHGGEGALYVQLRRRRR